MLYRKIYLFALVIFCSCQQESSSGGGTDNESNTLITLSEAQLQQALIQTTELQEKSMTEELEVSGVVDVPPQNMQTISVPLGGYLKETSLLPGMKVKKGQVIAILEDPVYIQLQKDYLVSSSRLVFLESEWLRQRELNQDKSASDKVVQQAEAEYLAEKVNRESLKKKLELIGIQTNQLKADQLQSRISIRSPLTGYVTRVHVNLGKYVNPTDVLFELVDPTDMHASLTVFEKDIPKIREGQSVRVRPVEQPGLVYPARVILPGKKLNDDRSIDVHCHFEKDASALIPGMFLKASIRLNGHQARAVPEQAVVRYQNRSFIFLEESKGKYRLQAVRTGVTNEGWTEILDSLPPVRIVSNGAYTLLSAMMNTQEED